MKAIGIGILMSIVALSVTAATEENSVLIRNPTHNYSNFSFSPQSSEEAVAVCKHLGFERFVSNSVVLGSQRIDVIRLNKDGTVHSAPLDYPMLEIICSNRRGPRLLEASVVVKNPFHSELKIPFAAFNADAAQGVCKYLGHDRFALNSGDLADKVTDVLILNREGSIRSASREYPIAQMVCIDKL